MTELNIMNILNKMIYLYIVFLSCNIFYADGRQLKFLRNEINFSAVTLNFNLDGTLICIDLPKSRKKNIITDKVKMMNMM